MTDTLWYNVTVGVEPVTAEYKPCIMTATNSSSKHVLTVVAPNYLDSGYSVYLKCIAQTEQRSNVTD